jgi:hypothetical protein
MRLRNFALLFAAVITLHAQLVEKPAPPTKRTHKSSPAKIAKPEPKPIKSDLLQEIKAPKTFRGVVIDLSAKRLDVIFRGIWVPSPHITGSGSSIEWSSYSALIADLDEQERLTFTFGFNLGRREGKLYARTFAWPRSASEVVPVKDEGSVREVDGGYVLDLDKRQVVLLPSEKPWVPAEAKLYRFIASEGSTPNQIPPQFNSLAVQNNSPRTVTFAGGSYLQLEDGPFLRVFFAPFGDQNLHQIRLFKQGDALLAEAPKRADGTKLKEEGWAWYSQLWGNGLSGFGDEPGYYNTHIQFLFRNGKLEEIRNESEQRATHTGSLSGSSEEVKLSKEVRREVLDRAKEASWVISGGPFSLRRTLLRAYEGCTIQPPRMATDPTRLTNNPQYHKWALDLYPAKIRQWRALAEEAGATFSEQPARPNVKTGPLGRVFPPGTTPETAASSEKKPAKSLLSIFGK